jgi:hypothetical protein
MVTPGGGADWAIALMVRQAEVAMQEPEMATHLKIGYIFIIELRTFSTQHDFPIRQSIHALGFYNGVAFLPTAILVGICGCAVLG